MLLALAGGLAALAVPAALAGSADRRRYLSAVGRLGGGYGLAGFDQDGGLWLDLPLPGRGHAVVLDPSGRRAVVLARRPGTFALAVELASGAVTQIESGPGRHFYGHGVFSPDGARLYSTENAYDEGRGAIGVRDATDGFRRLGELPSHGIGPHDLALLPDGRTLVVANGGIRTHPESGRRKLNLETMSPSLSYLERESGRLLDQASLDPALHRLSLRHLAVAADGEVAVAGQYQGGTEEAVPLLALHRMGGAPRLLPAPTETAYRTRNYCGHVALDESGAWLAASHPRGGLVTVWSRAEGRYRGAVALADGCGLAPAGGPGRFLISSGSGALLLHDAVAGESRRLGGALSGDLGWDNHLTAL